MKRDDSNTNIQYLKDLLRKFRDDRDWAQFHDPKNLAEAILIEAGELLELFLWKKQKEVKSQMGHKDFWRKTEEELADVIIMCFNFSNSVGIDVAKSILEKLETNERKYPVAKSKGTAKKYTEL